MKRTATILLTVALGALMPGTASAAEDPELVSTTVDGAPAKVDSKERSWSTSDDGNLVAFAADGDEGGIFVRNRSAGTTEKVADEIDPAKTPELRLSGNGRYLAVTQKISGSYRLGVHDLERGTYQDISESNGIQYPEGASISDDGQTVVFTAYTDTDEVHVADLSGEEPELSKPGISATDVRLSGDGKYVASLTITDDEAAVEHVYRTELATGEKELVDVLTDGEPAPKGASSLYDISDDGRYVLFTADDPDLPDGDCAETKCVIRKDMKTGELESALRDLPDNAGQRGLDPVMSDDGSRVASSARIETDSASPKQSFVRDIEAGWTRQVSVNGDGESAVAAPGESTENVSELSGDGEHVVFLSNAENLGEAGGAYHLWHHPVGGGS